MTNLDQPIGNVEMRLWMQKIETTTTQTHEQAKKTNGRVTRHGVMINWGVGALVVLTPIAGWLCTSVIRNEAQIAAIKAQQITPSQLQADIIDAMTNGFSIRQPEK